MLWRATLAVAVVCFGGMCSCVRADVMSRLMGPRDYGVKLCGREFIRAVIFTCGGSRWKRSIDVDSDSLRWNSFLDLTTEDNQQTWKRGAELTDGRPSAPGSSSSSSSYSLADLLTLYRAAGDRQHPSPSVPALTGDSANLGGLEGNGEVAAWPVSSKRKRNFSLGVAGMCCNQGCTKNDIGRLC
ncbi:unnamed protein product [Menidia menidia]|uniref:(Atlantic silverside) hypothetical protein n=1 Tax=Menidia menidia TaxID=238744 RepID=A0A8S4ALE4_9TELE|nr:unnamed protein product [Menidia menidia]